MIMPEPTLELPKSELPSAITVSYTHLYEILEKITSGRGTLEDLDLLEELCLHVKSSSLCGLGQTAPNPVLSTLRYFRDEYIALSLIHICKGMGGILKHFPGYGNNANTHTGIAHDARPYTQFQSEDFLPFEAGIDAGADCILSLIHI